MIETLDQFKYGPSEHLSWDELACNDGTPYPMHWEIDRAGPLGSVFEHIRRIVGGPIRINSAYRTAEYNRLVGGSRKSQHVEGCALDLALPKGMLMRDFLAVALEVAKYPSRAKFYPRRLNGIGVYPNFLHVDIRDTLRLVRWNGNRAAAELVRAA